MSQGVHANFFLIYNIHIKKTHELIFPGARCCVGAIIIRVRPGQKNFGVSNVLDTQSLLVSFLHND